MTKSIIIFDQNFILHPSGALYWEEEEWLLVSDVHLGKVAHFRKFGSPIPQQAAVGNFRKLSEVVTFFKPHKIVFLGDLFHSSLNREWRLFEAWMKTFSAEMLLIEGNHDIIPPVKYEELGVKILPELVHRNFLLTHHPEKRDPYFNFAGHIHPGVAMTGRARQTLKLPCFFKIKDQLIFPAFGEFTGNYILSPEPGDEVYVITGNEVIQIS